MFLDLANDRRAIRTNTDENPITGTNAGNIAHHKRHSNVVEKLGNDGAHRQDRVRPLQKNTRRRGAPADRFGQHRGRG